MMERFHTEFQQLVQFQEEIAGFHPMFKRSYPVALVEDEQLLIYDRPQGAPKYSFVRIIASPIPLPDGVMAAFPLKAYNGRTVAVVTPSIFEEEDGLVMLLHEFVHCYQAETCKDDVRSQLRITQEEEKRGHITWEIDHPFPYEDVFFIEYYTGFLRALAEGESEQADQNRHKLKEYLSYPDYEYMVWEEWNEGFARWNENRLRQYSKLPLIDCGTVPPYNRITFYVGGAAYIDHLLKREPLLQQDLPGLFTEMFAGNM